MVRTLGCLTLVDCVHAALHGCRSGRAGAELARRGKYSTFVARVAQEGVRPRLRHYGTTRAKRHEPVTTLWATALLRLPCAPDCVRRTDLVVDPRASDDAADR